VLESEQSANFEYNASIVDAGGGFMFAAQGLPQDPGFVMLMILIITLAVIFWRLVIKLLAIGVILLVVLGLYELLRILH
jgi:hypothetical protein